MESSWSDYTLDFESVGAPEKAIPLSLKEYENGAGLFLDRLRARNILDKAEDIHTVALRVVAPGAYFQMNREVDEAYLAQMDRVRRFAPLHVEPVFLEANRMRTLLPECRLLGISDSAFHAAIPDPYRRFAMPKEDAVSWDLHRFGYHGISVQSILRKIRASGPPPSRIIVCHLGSGASVTAIRDGNSVDNSMGFSPLGGLIMGTRAGDFDAGAVLFLAKTSGMELEELETYLNSRCGLLGMSGISSDLRVLLAKEREGNADAHSSIEAFVHRIRKYIGAYLAVLGGIDLLVFTGAIGERSGIIRERICRGLEGLGIVLSENLNRSEATDDRYIQVPDSKTGISVVATAEMAELAAQARDQE